jgi:hypothetical protein
MLCLIIKKLFGKEESSNVKMGDDFWEEDEMVTREENQVLEADFTEEEIFKAIKDSYAEGAPGPDSFSFLFYHKFWSVIKTDLMKVVQRL